MRKLALMCSALLIASPVFAAEPIIVDGCSVVETYDAHETINGDVRHSTTVVCYGDDHAPAVRKSSTSGLILNGSGGPITCCITGSMPCAPCR